MPRITARRLAAAACAATALGLGLAACGDDDGDAALSREEFVAQADAICAAGNVRIEALAQSLTGPPTEAEGRELALTVADDVSRQIDEIAALEPPEEMAADVAALVEQGREGVAALRADPQSLFADPSPMDGASAAAAELGMASCDA